jgi:hypothetical protein
MAIAGFKIILCPCSLSCPLLKYSTPGRGVTKRCRPSWLTNSALVYEPKCGGGWELRGFSQWIQLYSIFNLWLQDKVTHGFNFITLAIYFQRNLGHEQNANPLTGNWGMLMTCPIFVPPQRFATFKGIVAEEALRGRYINKRNRKIRA